MSDNFGKKILTFSLTDHPVLGFLIESFAVSQSNKGQFGYDFKKVSKNTLWDHFTETDPDKLTLTDILDKYSDQQLQKRFNPSHKRTLSFYENLDHDYVIRHIRPFIDRIIFEAISLMSEKNIPLFFKGSQNERIREKPIILHKQPVETCFHFEKLENKTHYKLQITHKDRLLYLYDKQAQLITTKPCILLLDNEIYRFQPGWDGKKLEPFFRKEYIEVPAASEKQFYQKFVQKSILHHSFINKGFDVDVNTEKPIPVLKVDEHWQGEIMFSLGFSYGKNMHYYYGDEVKSDVRFIENWPDFHFLKLIRNIDHEKEMAQLLVKLGLSLKEGPYLDICVADKANGVPPQNKQKKIHFLIDWLNENHSTLTNLGFILEKEISEKKYFSGVSHLNLEPEENNDWFDLGGTVRFGNVEVPFISLRENILQGNREYIMPDGTIALIPEEWMSTFQDVMRFSQKKGNHLQIKKHHYPFLADLEETGIKLPAFSDFSLTEDQVLPALKNVEMRPYQIHGYNWMVFLRKNKLGGCLADDMGLGKTLQTLAILTDTYFHDKQPEGAFYPVQQNISSPGMQLDLFDDTDGGNNQLSQKNCSLIIMPLSLVHNWMEEIKRFSPGLKVFQHIGISRPANTAAFSGYQIVLTTYGTVRNDIEMLQKYHFNYVILDESQIIKNASSKIFSAIKKLRSEHRLVLSGTPVENSLTDLWSQFSFLNPGMLGSLSFFKNEFVNPIEKKQDNRISDKLQKLIQPFVLRRTKQQVAKELPELIEKVHYCEMTPEQEKYYETRKSEIRNSILKGLDDKGPDKSRFIVLSGLTKLRLIANHPAIVDQDYNDLSGKYTEIIRSIENLMAEDHKVLIFSQFVKHLNLFRDYFQQSGYKFSLLTGNVSEKDRQQVIGNFQQEKDNRLFLISLKAGGVGLNLTSAGYVFMLDPWWNPAVEKQAINRAHRIGQDKNVIVYKFITRNTVEEKILKLQHKKSKIANLLIRQDNLLKTLSFGELQELI
ncbi:MAG: DEAD/DEAH box helicase [Bacteroidales bacterium]